MLYCSPLYPPPSGRESNYVIIITSLILQFLKLGLVEKFHRCLVHGPRPRYHASRALVYLGKLEMLKDISLFAPVATGEWNGVCDMEYVDILYQFLIPGYETDVVIQTTDSDGHTYARYSSWCCNSMCVNS